MAFWAPTSPFPCIPVASALVGLLISLPDTFIAKSAKSYVGILGTGLLFGALTRWAAKAWGNLEPKLAYKSQ